ncbi:MAG TPA: O-antigen ligase family protein [Candidatus Pacearchaeota archaeon]|nr:O-antigen ligase family protein [Candidatus Pacearchaeota archaeon]
MMNNTLTIPKVSGWKLLLLILLGVIIGLIMLRGDILFWGILMGLVFFVLLVRNPELSLAILFNGTFIYFYLVYKMGFETSRLLTGGFFAFLAVSFLLGGILIAKRPQKFRPASIDLLFTCFFSLVFLSYIMFRTGSESAYRKITYAPLLVVAPYFGIRLLTSKEGIKKFFNYCVLVAAILVIPALYELFFNPVFAGSGRFSMYMFPERGNNPILFGITFAILLIILFVWGLEQRKLKFKYLILMVPAMFLLLRSGSRGAVISFLVAMLFYLLIIGRLKFKTKIYAAIVLVFLIVGAYKIIPEPIAGFYQYTFTPEARENPVSSVYKRITMWKEAINDFETNPILGVGIGNSVGGIGFPHNILLEVAAELGVFGLLIIISMFYLTIKKALAFIKKKEMPTLNTLMKLSLTLFIYSLTEAMFSGYITNQTRLFMSMGIIVSLVRLKQEKVSSQNRQVDA